MPDRLHLFKDVFLMSFSESCTEDPLCDVMAPLQREARVPAPSLPLSPGARSGPLWPPAASTGLGTDSRCLLALVR